MPWPNLIIAGSQKSGTTWLHSALGKSASVLASTTKELNYFNHPNPTEPRRVEEYLANFPETDGVRYYLESTPHYFRVAEERYDIAANIKGVVPDARILVMFRDPVHRYESAYIHHMMAGRFRFTDRIVDLTDQYSMIRFGRYAEILEHWRTVFPSIEVLFYDDLVADPPAFVHDVMERLDLVDDIDPAELDFRLNDKTVKSKRLGDDWQVMPQLDGRLRSILTDLYRDDTKKLEELTGRDLSGWLTPG